MPQSTMCRLRHVSLCSTERRSTEFDSSPSAFLLMIIAGVWFLLSSLVNHTRYQPSIHEMPSSRPLAMLLLGGTLFFAYVQADCFFPDGTSDPDGFPCNSTTGAITHCCRTFEACLDKGACYTQWDSQFYRRSCTDQNWGDGCPTVCTNGKSVRVL